MSPSVFGYAVLGLGSVVMLIALIPFFAASIMEVSYPSWRPMRQSWARIFYAGAGIAAIAAFWIGLKSPGGISIGQVAMLGLVAGLFAAMFAGLVWFGRAILQRNLAGNQPPRPEATVPPASAVGDASVPGIGSLQPPSPWYAHPLFTPKTIALYIVIFVLGSVVVPHFHLERFPTGSHPLLLTTAIVIAAAGLIAFVAGAFSLLMVEGHQLTEEEAGQRTPFSRTIPGPLSRVVSFDFTVGEIKAAWRAGEWYRHPHWRRIFGIVGGAIAMLLGFLCALLLGSPPENRTIVDIWLIFVLVWLGWTFARG